MKQPLKQAIAQFSPRLPLAIAYSGGADSTALLVACTQKWPGHVVAFHVNHGLQTAAENFEHHCRCVCAKLTVPLTVKRIDARHQPGQSPEDAARQARYEALHAMAIDHQAQSTIRSIAIAQHADDQVETILLALSRGAGLPGLSAMPRTWTRHGVEYHRPLLGVSGVALREWLRSAGVDFIEDPSNVNLRFTRNRIRAYVLPVLRQCFPHYHETFARSARHAAQAQLLLNEMAASDLAQLGQPPKISPLRQWSKERQANVLRYWLKTVHHAIPSAAQLDELLRQIAHGTGRRLHLRVAQGWCCRKGDCLDWYNFEL